MMQVLYVGITCLTCPPWLSYRDCIISHWISLILVMELISRSLPVISISFHHRLKWHLGCDKDHSRLNDMFV